MLKRKVFLIFIHFVCWLLFAAFPPLVFNAYPLYVSYSKTLTSPYYWYFVFSFIFLFYFTTEYLIPKLYLKHKHFQYYGSLFLVFVVYFFLKPFEFMWLYIIPQKEFAAYNPFGLDIFSIFTFIVIVSIGIALQIIRQWRLSELQAKEAAAEKSQALAEKKSAELSFLKAQINPHFLFNTLNNIYTLAIRQSPNTAPSIMKLSNIMRYLTDDVTKEFIPLKREIECIRDYINLQSLRLGSNNIIDFEITGKTDNKKIAPLILMTFIENVFKYGITTRGEAIITIKLISDKDRITFFCRNSILVSKNFAETTGIGLANTRHRLELIYPHKHTLDIEDENGLFTVSLTLLD